MIFQAHSASDPRFGPVGRISSEATVAFARLVAARRALAPFGGPLTLNLYSEGAAADFRAFAEAGCALHIGGDPFETLHNMVTADVLIGTPSNFSYIAGLLSRSIMVDARPRKVPLENWVCRNGKRDIPIQHLRRVLARRLSWPERCTYRLRLWWRRVARVAGAGA